MQLFWLAQFFPFAIVSKNVTNFELSLDNSKWDLNYLWLLLGTQKTIDDRVKGPRESTWNFSYLLPAALRALALFYNTIVILQFPSSNSFCVLVKQPATFTSKH